MTHYQHLSHEERFYIHQAVREGKRNVEIARARGLHDQPRNEAEHVAQRASAPLRLGAIFPTPPTPRRQARNLIPPACHANERP